MGGVDASAMERASAARRQACHDIRTLLFFFDFFDFFDFFFFDLGKAGG